MTLPDPVPAEFKAVVADRTFTVTSASITGVIDAGTTYAFVIRAVKGDVSSDWSAPVHGTTEALGPAVPTALTVTPRGESTIWLSWTQLPGDELPHTVGAATSHTIRYRVGTSSTLRTFTVTGRTTHAPHGPFLQYGLLLQRAGAQLGRQ